MTTLGDQPKSRSRLLVVVAARNRHLSVVVVELPGIDIDVWFPLPGIDIDPWLCRGK